MKIPDRWERYEALGSVIPGTRFIAFKTPLKNEIVCNKLEKKYWFSPEILMQSMVERKLTLGLVIDLTWTSRYYNYSDFTENSVQYEKINTMGHQIPNKQVYGRFVEAIEKFEQENKDTDALIGVHCTHGINRTGYLVCRYMIEKLQHRPDKAIEVFGEARGYPIERKHYIDNLMSKIPGEEGEDQSEGADGGKEKATHHQHHYQHHHRQYHHHHPHHHHQHHHHQHHHHHNKFKYPNEPRSSNWEHARPQDGAYGQGYHQGFSGGFSNHVGSSRHSGNYMPGDRRDRPSRWHGGWQPGNSGAERQFGRSFSADSYWQRANSRNCWSSSGQSPSPNKNGAGRAFHRQRPHSFHDNSGSHGDRFRNNPY